MKKTDRKKEMNAGRKQKIFTPSVFLYFFAVFSSSYVFNLAYKYDIDC
jgi:hypothetical protein